MQTIYDHITYLVCYVPFVSMHSWNCPYVIILIFISSMYVTTFCDKTHIHVYAYVLFTVPQLFVLFLRHYLPFEIFLLLGPDLPSHNAQNANCAGNKFHFDVPQSIIFKFIFNIHHITYLLIFSFFSSCEISRSRENWGFIINVCSLLILHYLLCIDIPVWYA